MADLYKMAVMGHQGVDLLISDSTNALNEGMSISESRVDDTLTDIFDKYKYNRIIIATFASNIYRLKHIFESCYKHNRKICVFGRSMENNIDISIKGGYIDHKELLIRADEANNLKQENINVSSTENNNDDKDIKKLEEKLKKVDKLITGYEKGFLVNSTDEDIQMKSDGMSLLA